MRLADITKIPLKFYRALKYANELYERDQLCRYTKDQFAQFGDNSVIQNNVYITHPSRVVIGMGTTIQCDTIISSMGGVHIGNYVGIGQRSMIISFQHGYRSGKAIPYDDSVLLQPVVIRDYAWLGWGVMVLPGIEIGEGSIVGVGALVTKDVPARAIVLGNPASIVGYRSEDHFERCKAEGRVQTHRVLETYGRFEEKIPPFTMRKFAKELKEMNMI